MLFATTAQGQKGGGPYNAGDMQLGVSVGVSGWGMPVHLEGSYFVLPELECGLELSARIYRERWAAVLYQQTGLGAAAFGNYYLTSALGLPASLEAYAGAALGYFHVRQWWKDAPRELVGPRSAGANVAIRIGGRYHVDDHVTVKLELEYATATYGGARVGLGYRF